MLDCKLPMLHKQRSVCPGRWVSTVCSERGEELQLLLPALAQPLELNQWVQNGAGGESCRITGGGGKETWQVQIPLEKVKMALY